ncbi:MAG: LysR family transcriptional regulator [Halocynthiibacter sp.]
MSLDWDDLRIFLAVSRNESLLGAGKALKIDPATVGRRITRLEEAVGTGLFQRSRRGYTLTEEGQRLITHAERVEQSFQQGLEELKGEAGKLTGSIRVGAPDGCASFVLPQVCARICAENPGLDVQIIALPRVVDLSKREADLAVTVSAPTAGRLLVQKITDYRLHLVAAHEYLAKHTPITTLDSVLSHKFIGYIPDMIFDKELDYLREAGAERVAFASNSVTVQLNWIRQGAGVAVAHDFVLPFAPELRKICETEFSLTRSFYLVRHANDRRLERVNRFAALLRDGIRVEVARLEGRLAESG